MVCSRLCAEQEHRKAVACHEERSASAYLASRLSRIHSKGAMMTSPDWKQILGLCVSSNQLGFSKAGVL